MSDYTVTYTAPCPNGTHEAEWRGSQAEGLPDVVCTRCESMESHPMTTVPLYRPSYVARLAALGRVARP